MIHSKLIDPMKLKELLWPDVVFYGKQEEIIYSVEESRETIVPAGNKMGKDFVTGFICPCLFIRCMIAGLTCRIVTTSVAEHHLTVLWGEIGRFISTAKHPLLVKRGGPLSMNHMEMRRASEMESKNPLNYLVGRVSAKGEGLAGHHADVTLAVADEASGMDDQVYSMFQGWAARLLLIGNPNPPGPGCRTFYEAVKGGEILAET